VIIRPEHCKIEDGPGGPVLDSGPQ
jgi:hypothetical protein